MIKELDFSATTHQYFLEGKELISVTRTFEKVGVTDFSKVPFQVIEPAREKGDIVHDMAAMFGYEVLDEESVAPEYSGYLNSIKNFFKEEVKKIIAIEQPIYNVQWGYAGTLDILYLNKSRELVLDDWKTPKRLQLASKWQTAAYAFAYEKLSKKKIVRRHAVHLREDGSYVLQHHTNPLRRDFDEFLTFQRAAVLMIKNNLGRE